MINASERRLHVLACLSTACACYFVLPLGNVIGADAIQRASDVYFDWSDIDNTIDSLEDTRLKAYFRKVCAGSRPFEAAFFYDILLPKWQSSFVDGDLRADGKGTEVVMEIVVSKKDALLFGLGKGSRVSREHVDPLHASIKEPLTITCVTRVDADTTRVSAMITRTCEKMNSTDKVEVVRYLRYDFVPRAENQKHKWILTDEARENY